MMCEVVNHSDTVHFSAHFTTTADACKAGECITDAFAICTPRVGGDDYRQAITKIKLADQRRLKFSPGVALAKYFEVHHAARVTDVSRLPLRVLASPERLE